jgi:hypothetical protein
MPKAAVMPPEELLEELPDELLLDELLLEPLELLEDELLELPELLEDELPEPDPAIEMVAVAAPSFADPVGLLNATEKVLVPVNAVVLETATVNVFAAASPEAQLNVPLALV